MFSYGLVFCLILFCFEGCDFCVFGLLKVDSLLGLLGFSWFLLGL